MPRGVNIDTVIIPMAMLVLLLAAPFAAGPVRAQTNECQWSFDGECDEPGIGSGLCARGTDVADCQSEAESCQFSLDGECDEPIIGTGLCSAGTDSNDCIPVANSCEHAFNDICDDPTGTDLCETGTDASDCGPRDVAGPNSCKFAFDGECDETGSGTGVCSVGTDTADCRRRALAGGPDSCTFADDGECDEPGIGTGNCMAGTDTKDCRGISAPSSLVFQIQSLLQSLGYDPGSVDGQIGPATRDAIHDFQRERRLPQTGQATQDLLDTLQSIY